MPDLCQLDMIQRWMQSVITHPDGVVGGIASDEARGEIDVPPEAIEQVICRSKALTSIERLEVYGNAYYARLLECLRESFPVVAATVGEEVFDQFSFGYLQCYPSQSYTLSRLGENLARHLQETRPDIEEHERGEVGFADFLIDLVNLEWTIDKVFDGPGVEGRDVLSADDLAAIEPARWPDARLVPAPCLKLLKFRYPINDYFTAVRQDEEPAPPEPADSYLAITRRDYIVRRIPLSRPQFDLLSELVAGQTVGEAIERAVDSDADFDHLAADLQQWFATWTAARLFERVEIPGPDA